MNLSTTPISILVTAVGGGGHGEQILKALRLAPAGRYRILAADANPRCPQLRLADERFTLPLAGDPAYLGELLQLCRHNGVRALFHGCEPELKVMSANREKFAEAGIFLPINPAAVIDICMDKVRTAEALRALGFEPPRFLEVRDPEDLSRVDFFPVVVKPSVGGGGSAQCYIAQDERQLQGLSMLLELGRSGQAFMIQEYVGTPAHEYTVGVLHDMDGNFINSIGIRRELASQLNVRLSLPNRTDRADLGPKLVVSSGISHGWVDRFPEVTGPCERIARGLGARGAINIQCRLVDGVVKVFEINPRFSGTTSIRAMMGYNEPDVLLRRHLLSEQVQERFDYGRGLVLRSLTETLVDDHAEVAAPSPSGEPPC